MMFFDNIYTATGFAAAAGFIGLLLGAAMTALGLA